MVPQSQGAHLQIEQFGFKFWLGTLCFVLGQKHFTFRMPLSTQVNKLTDTGKHHAGSDNHVQD